MPVIELLKLIEMLDFIWRDRRSQDLNPKNRPYAFVSHFSQSDLKKVFVAEPADYS